MYAAPPHGPRLSFIYGDIATALGASDLEAEQQRIDDHRHAEQRRRTVVSKIDRGCEDFSAGKISEAFWTRKSAEWEAELPIVEQEQTRLERQRAASAVTAEKS